MITVRVSVPARVYFDVAIDDALADDESRIEVPGREEAIRKAIVKVWRKASEEACDFPHSPMAVRKGGIEGAYLVYIGDGWEEDVEDVGDVE